MGAVIKAIAAFSGVCKNRQVKCQKRIK